MWQNLHKMQNDWQPEESQLYYLQNERTTFKPVLNGNVLVVTLFFKVPQFFLLNNSHLKGKNEMNLRTISRVKRNPCFSPKVNVSSICDQVGGFKNRLFPLLQYFFLLPSQFAGYHLYSWWTDIKSVLPKNTAQWSK